MVARDRVHLFMSHGKGKLVFVNLTPIFSPAFIIAAQFLYCKENKLWGGGYKPQGISLTVNRALEVKLFLLQRFPLEMKLFKLSLAEVQKCSEPATTYRPRTCPSVAGCQSLFRYKGLLSHVMSQ